MTVKKCKINAITAPHSFALILQGKFVQEHSANSNNTSSIPPMSPRMASRTKHSLTKHPGRVFRTKKHRQFTGTKKHRLPSRCTSFQSHRAKHSSKQAQPSKTYSIRFIDHEPILCQSLTGQIQFTEQIQFTKDTCTKAQIRFPKRHNQFKAHAAHIQYPRQHKQSTGTNAAQIQFPGRHTHHVEELSAEPPISPCAPYFPGAPYNSNSALIPAHRHARRKPNCTAALENECKYEGLCEYGSNDYKIGCLSF